MIKQLQYYTLTLILLSCTLQSHAQEKVEVLSKLEQGLGGKESIQQARFLMFSCKPLMQTRTIGLHKYIYNRESGDVRFESQTIDKRSIVVLFNIKTKIGDVYLDHLKVDSQEIVSSVIQYFKEDSYWLLGPILLVNNELQASLEHSQLIDSKRYYVVKVIHSDFPFQYSNIFLDAITGIISRWQTFDNKGEKDYDFMCLNTKDIGGGLRLPTVFIDSQKSASIQYPVIAALINVEIEKFKTP